MIVCSPLHQQLQRLGICFKGPEKSCKASHGLPQGSPPLPTPNPAEGTPSPWARKETRNWGPGFSQWWFYSRCFINCRAHLRCKAGFGGGREPKPQWTQPFVERGALDLEVSWALNPATTGAQRGLPAWASCLPPLSHSW